MNLQPPLGPGYVYPVTIYANRKKEDCLWYSWDKGANRHIPIRHTAISGHLTQLEVRQRQYKDKDNFKLSIVLHADWPYEIEAGLRTDFARDVLIGVANVPDEALAHPLLIGVEPGGEPDALFGRVAYWTGSRHEHIVVKDRPEKEDRSSWTTVFRVAQAKVHALYPPETD